MNRQFKQDASGILGRHSLGMVFSCLVWAAVCGPALGEDWPTYHHDSARSAISSESLALPLTEHWSFTTGGEPVPGWAPPQSVPVEGFLELPRVHYDDVYHLAVADGTVYFGSSAENKVCALDAATGEERWSVFTGGAVRLAPSVWNGRVYFGADDGWVYCVSAADGAVIWKFRAAPTDEMLLGRGRMVSLWPIRTGVLVDDGTAYFGAGIFPGERVYLCAVRADDGKLVWKNDYMSYPSGGGSSRFYGFSPQGYLLASATKLYVPSGRNAPAVFDRADGDFIHQLGSAWGKTGFVGGSYALLAGDGLYGGTGELTAYGGQSGRSGFAWFPGQRLVVTDEFAYMLGDTGVCALDREKYPEASRNRQALRGKRRNLTRAKPTDLEDQLKALDEEEKDADELIAAARPWQRSLAGFESMILAGNRLCIGGEGQVMALDVATGETRWTGKINGVAKGLAAADGRLLVSTDEGTIYCFAPGPQPRREQVERQPPPPYPQDRLTPVYEAAADAILKESGVERGFCLVLGCGTGRLALELAKRTEDLMIYGVDPDAEKVAAARKALDAAGVYGTRVCVDQADLWSVPHSDYFANLIVSEDALISGALNASPKETRRMLKPLGGTLCIGQPAEAKGVVKPLDMPSLRRWVQAGGMSGYRMIEGRGTWAKFVRGPLEGAENWTHQYGDAGNAGSSQDRAVKCPLGMLWFGDPGPDVVVNRHRGTAAPLVVKGRTFLQGNNYIVAFDPYNGVKLWERDIPGAYRVNMARDCSNLAATEDSLFVATGTQCLRLDAATGETQATYDMPPPPDETPRTWAYVAVVGDILVGSTAQRALYSDAVFAVDVGTGAFRWVHHGKSIKNNAICVSDGRVLFVDDSATSEQRQEGLGETATRLAAEKGISLAEAEKQIGGADIRVAVAIDLASGNTLWEKPVDLTDCGGSVLVGMSSRGVFAFAGAHKNGHFWPQFLGGEFATRRVVAISAEDGSLLWSKAVGYRMRPIIIGDTLYAEPWGFDLRTGKQKMRTHPVTGASSVWEFERPGHHCGAVSGSPNALFFRSGSIGYYDLVSDHGTEHFSGQRAGCWINIIPANGLVVVPEASSGCVCLYSIHCTTVFKPRAFNRAWAIYDATGELTPVRHMAINLGAAGDRRDTRGTLWLSYPRPSGRMRVNFDLGVSGGAKYFTSDTEYTQLPGTGKAWLFASGCSGLTKCTVPLLKEEDGAAIYTVRLGFVDTENQRPGERVFDIKLQGEVVDESFDIIRAAGGPNKAVVKEFEGIEVQDDLVIELVPTLPEPAGAELPTLNSIEVIRTRALRVGLKAPSFLLSGLVREDAAEVKIGNHTDREFVGTLELTAPDGFAVTPSRTDVRLAPEETTTVPVKVAVARRGDAANLQVDVKLLRGDETVESQSQAALEYLGPRERVVIEVAEDASVAKRTPTVNHGHEASVMVDGGSQAMVDQDHRLGYLKFRVDIPGKSHSVKLRMHVAPSQGAESGKAGRICIVAEPWDEHKITYTNRPKPGKEVATVGRVERGAWVVRPLDVELSGKMELSLVLEPTTTDAANYLSREGGSPPELVVEYVPGK